MSKQVNDINNKKFVGSIAAVLSLALFTYIIKGYSEKFTNFTNCIGDTIEKHAQVNVENFGDNGPVRTGPAPHGTARVPRATGPAQPLGPYPGQGAGGATQLASYQMYQQAVNAATPTIAQLINCSNQPSGGFGEFPANPGNTYGPPWDNSFWDAAAVDYGNRRAELISPCAQNAPTFVASSLLPQVNIPGVPSWNVDNLQGGAQALANQNFLSATQQMGTDTVLSSLRNSSYDIRNNIPNPINVVSPWLNSTITPDLERRPLDCYIPQNGLYGCGYPCSYGQGNNPVTGKQQIFPQFKR